ncbi:MAG: LytTR family DNA-binding domain-containing protein, partial [Lachnospiraceae bacterium]|nr:LytTR family DNA-binding domain-containing protein [Lachnospiraceae bacterium]
LAREGEVKCLHSLMIIMDSFLGQHNPSNYFALTDNKTEKQKYAFKTENGIVTLELDEIFYFEYLARKVVIHGTEGNYVATYKLKELLEKFEQYNFASPHKSFIVNMLYIKSIKGFDIFIENGDKIPLAQKRAVEFKNIFNDFLQETFDRI